MIEKENIVNILLDRKANLPCGRCGGTELTLLDNYFHEVINNTEFVPTVMIVCNTCGHLTKHAVNILK